MLIQTASFSKPAVDPSTWHDVLLGYSDALPRGLPQRSVDVHPPNFFRTSKVLIHLTWSWLVQYASTSFIIHFHSLCYIPSVDGYLLFMANPPYCSSIFMLKLSSINPTFLMIHPCWPPRMWSTKCRQSPFHQHFFCMDSNHPQSWELVVASNKHHSPFFSHFFAINGCCKSPSWHLISSYVVS